ncbi:MAG: class I SAM-dependent methyltransferase [Vicinamibacteria bacterium]
MQALPLYRKQTLGVRLHTRLRAWSAPLGAVVDALPLSGSLLDIGCGHGLVSNEAWLRGDHLRVLGVDLSETKIASARASVGDRADIEFRHARLEEVPETGFDAVALIDVLYLVPESQWDGFLRICLQKLRAGGLFVLKEITTEPRWKFERLKLQEFMSTRVLRITTGDKMYFESSAALASRLERIGFESVAVRHLDAGYTSPHVLFTGRRPRA